MDTTLVVAIIAPILSGVITYFVTISRTRYEMKGEFSAYYQKEKFNTHRLLWAKLSPLSPRDSAYVLRSKDRAKKWAEEIIRFFYSEHGLLIQKPVRSKLFDVVEYIESDQDKTDAELDHIKRELLKVIADSMGQSPEQGRDFNTGLLE